MAKAWLVYELEYDEDATCDECNVAPTSFKLAGIYLNEHAARNHALQGYHIEETELIP